MVWRFVFLLVLSVVAFAGLGVSVAAQDEVGRLITVYDRGDSRAFLSDAETLGEALAAQNITLDERDTIEPSIDEELVAPEYQVNIYRARPVFVVDGAVRVKTMSAHQTAQHIAEDAGIVVYDEDETTVEPTTDFVGDGAGLQMTISRATVLTLDLYGKKTEVRTQAETVGDMLKEKAIELGDIGQITPSVETPITVGMQIRIWREGKQTVSIDEEIPFSSEIAYDADRPLGYRAVQSPGTTGIRSVTYELEIRDGVEISRVEIAGIVTRNPVQQVEVIGLLNNGSGLTVSRGAQYWTDSKGVSHRETYYDLNMGVVMRSCGQGGSYSVRPDGAKVDAQGYILVAANYGNYPKCSIVETSLGLGKVYDTGGFAVRHPHGFDLATDWTRADGI